jgi:hypothetical protein
MAAQSDATEEITNVARAMLRFTGVLLFDKDRMRYTFSGPTHGLTVMTEVPCFKGPV